VRVQIDAGDSVPAGRSRRSNSLGRSRRQVQGGFGGAGVRAKPAASRRLCPYVVSSTAKITREMMLMARFLAWSVRPSSRA